MRIILISLLLLFGAVTLAAEHDCETESSSSSSAPTPIPESTPIPGPTATPEPTPIPESKYNCRDLELEYNNVSTLMDYELTLQHVANIMNIKDEFTTFNTAGDAERELQKCGIIP